MFDTEKFIAEIELRPPLYAVTSKEYNSREGKALCWAEVGEAMYSDWSIFLPSVKENKIRELIKKWKAIRDSFVKEVKMIASTKEGEVVMKKRYVYWDNLQFLLPYIRPNIATHGEEQLNYQEDWNGDDYEEFEEKFTPPANISPSPVRFIPSSEGARKRKQDNLRQRTLKRVAAERTATRDIRSVLAENLALQRSDREADRFGHRSFMLSFVPILNSMPLHAAMQARVQVAQLVGELHAISTANNDGSGYEGKPPLLPTVSFIRHKALLTPKVSSSVLMRVINHMVETLITSCWV